MSQIELDEFERQILEFLCRWIPYESNPPRFERREEVCGELRLSLSEYDAACGRLERKRLIVSDQPASGELDFVAPTKAGRRLVSAPPQPGGFSWRILEFLGAHTKPGTPGFASLDVLQALHLAMNSAGIAAYQKACQALYDWDLITRQAQGENLYALIALTSSGRQALEER
jgi:hypothetical protein